MMLLYINALICAATCLRLISYQRGGATHKPVVAWLAYVLIVATGSVAIRAVLGTYSIPVDPSEVVINAVLCVASFCARGNVAALCRLAAWDGSERRKNWQQGGSQ